MEELIVKTAGNIEILLSGIYIGVNSWLQPMLDNIGPDELTIVLGILAIVFRENIAQAFARIIK